MLLAWGSDGKGRTAVLSFFILHAIKSINGFMSSFVIGYGRLYCDEVSTQGSTFMQYMNWHISRLHILLAGMTGIAK